MEKNKNTISELLFLFLIWDRLQSGEVAKLNTPSAKPVEIKDVVLLVQYRSYLLALEDQPLSAFLVMWRQENTNSLCYLNVTFFMFQKRLVIIFSHEKNVTGQRFPLYERGDSTRLLAK